MPSLLGLCAVLVAILVLASACDSSKSAVEPSTPTRSSTIRGPAASKTACNPPQVQYTPYPGHGDGLSQIPWIRGEPRESGLVALLWYWPQEWQRRQVREARIFTGAVAPAGYNVKVMWIFLSRSAAERGGSDLVVDGRRLDGPGRFKDSFAAIGYAGQRKAPSYASIIVVPEPGCWRLNLSSGQLRAHADFRAVKSKR
jgi:hypothetical protein